jgi:hypothetical protein
MRFIVWVMMVLLPARVLAGDVMACAMAIERAMAPQLSVVTSQPKPTVVQRSCHDPVEDETAAAADASAAACSTCQACHFYAVPPAAFRADVLFAVPTLWPSFALFWHDADPIQEAKIPLVMN